MEILKLKTRPRSGSGTSYAIKARSSGWIPAIFYGHKREPLKLEVDQREFASLVRGRKLTHLIDLGLGAQEDSIAVVREVQRHVLKSEFFIHIDFQHVAMDQKVTVECPIEIVGVSVGVKENGGVLEHPVRKLTIECMPLEIPEKITVDVSALNIGDSIHVRDLVVPGVTIKDPGEEVVAAVTHATREEEAKTAEGEGAEAAATPAAPAAEAKPAAKPSK